MAILPYFFFNPDVLFFNIILNAVWNWTNTKMFTHNSRIIVKLLFSFLAGKKYLKHFLYPSYIFSGTQISQLPLRLPWWTRMLVHPQSSGQRKNYLSGNFRFRHGTWEGFCFDSRRSNGKWPWIGEADRLEIRIQFH